jgi:NAD(P)-dependent dehydrogenase (short-subunit alcohol dehydrogenase family)
MESLEGKTAVVTGGASGMGLAFAQRFGQAGMRVVVGDIERGALDAAVEGLKEAGIDALGVVTDVSSGSSMEALLSASLAAYDQLNVVCLNAGVAGAAGRSWALGVSDWEWTLGVNLWGVIHGIRVFVPHLLSHGDGHVVTTASIAGHLSAPYGAPYNVSKHGVVTMTESLAHELKLEGSTVGVTLLCPGFVSTNIGTSHRNRPDALGGAERDERGARWLDRAQRALAAGKPPAEVADLVHDAVLASQFYLFTDEIWDGPIAQRHAQIRERQPPTLGRPGR